MSEPCTRFTQDGLAQLEEGAPLDAHYDTCADCGQARQAYARVVEELGRTREVLPPPGWEARVFEELDARRRGRGPHWVKRLAVAAVVVVAGAAPFLMRKGASPVLPLRLSVEVMADEHAQLRGQAAHAGDRLKLLAQVTPGENAELRVWREGELVLRCPGAALCRQEGAALSGELKLPAVGRYQALVVSSPKQLAPPLPRYADDAAALLAAGARVEMAEPVDVY